MTSTDSDNYVARWEIGFLAGGMFWLGVFVGWAVWS